MNILKLAGLIIATLVLLLLAAVYYYTLPGKDLDISVPEIKKTQQTVQDEKKPTRQSSGLHAKINDSVRTVEVPIEHTGSNEQVILDRYQDPNYDFSVTFPHGYYYNISDTAVLFASKERSMRFSAEIIYTLKNGGLFSSEDAVKEDYLNQLKDFSPTVLSSSYKTINGKKLLVFAVEYMIEGRGAYVNTFAIGSSVDYFYVLQFLTPKGEYDTEQVLIQGIINDFSFNS